MDDLERTLLDAERPEPGDDVRARVLAAAMPLVRADDSRLDRLWFSWNWRAAAVLALLALAGAEAWLPDVASWSPVAQADRRPSLLQTVMTAAQEAGLTQGETAAIVAQAMAAERTRQ